MKEQDVIWHVWCFASKVLLVKSSYSMWSKEVFRFAKRKEGSHYRISSPKEKKILLLHHSWTWTMLQLFLIFTIDLQNRVKGQFNILNWIAVIVALSSQGENIWADCMQMEKATSSRIYINCWSLWGGGWCLSWNLTLNIIFQISLWKKAFSKWLFGLAF